MIYEVFSWIFLVMSTMTAIRGIPKDAEVWIPITILLFIASQTSHIIYLMHSKSNKIIKEKK